MSNMTNSDVTREDIIAYKSEAATAGDEKQVEMCEAALDGDADAYAECARLIREVRALNT